MSSHQALGKGLDSLLPNDFDQSLLLAADERVQKLFISAIQPNPEQPRRHFDQKGIEELASSIKQYGVLQPIIVSPLADDTYEIIAGERRWRASQQAGLTHIPAIVRAKAELERLEIAMIENVQRVDLSPIEQAISIERLHEQFNLSYQEIANKLGKAATTINNIVRLLQLPPVARDALQSGVITEGHARAILALKDNTRLQLELLNAIRDKGWSVRQAEQFVTAHKQGAKTTQAAAQKTVSETPQTKQLASRLATKVTLKRTAHGGRLEIYFKDDHDLEALYKKLT